MAQPPHIPHGGPVRYAPQQEADPRRAAVEAAVGHIPGVKGIGEGRDEIGDPAWIVYVQDQSVAAKLPARIAGQAVVTEVTGEIDIQPA